MSAYLDIHRDNARESIEQSLPLLLRGALTYPRLLTLCESHRIAGIVHLLLDAEPEVLHRHLFDSGRTFLHGLTVLPTDDVVVSRAAPLLDALACNDVAGARDIARVLPRTWKSDIEYEDDALYVQWLAARAADADEPARRGLLERLVAAAPADDARAAVARALEDGDGAAFDDALRALLERYRAHHRTLASRGVLSDEAAATLPYFCAEGLALLQLAQRVGLPVAPEYPCVSPLARADHSAGFDPDGWRRSRAG